MIARVSIFKVNVDKLEEVKKAFEEGIIPAVKLQKGYRKDYLLTKHKTGKWISIALLDSKEAAITD